MLKILMILSIAAMIVTGVFGWQNRQTFVEERKQKHSLNKQIVQLKETVYDEAKETSRQHVILTTTEEERAVAAELLRSAERELATAQTKLGGIEGEVERKETELANLQKKLDEFQAMVVDALGPIKIDDIEPKYKELQKIVEDGKAELKQLGDELNVAKENLANKIKDRKGLEVKQDARKKEFARNTLSARVIEVSNEWGFVVFNAGKNKKIDGKTDLLVVRPGMGGICKLSVIGEPNETKTTAEIRQETIAPGVTVRVGDQVIIGTPR